MSSSITNTLKAQLYKQFSDDPFISIYELSHPNFASTFYFCSNTEDITSNGQVYQFYPISLSLPTDDGESNRELSIQLDNINLDLIIELRQITTPVDVNVKLVLASEPDTIQIEYPNLKLSNISYDSSKITGNLTIDDFLSKGLTSERYNPEYFPGIFG